MTNRVAKILGVEKPIIQAPMTLLTDAKLASAVSNAGGYGILGIGAGQSQMELDPVKDLKNIEKEVKKTKQLTDKPFGLVITPTPIKKEISDATTGASEASRNKDVGSLSKAIVNADENDQFDLDKDIKTNGLIKIAKENDIKTILYVGTFMSGWVKRIHEAGLKVIYRPLTPEIETIKKAVNAKVDAIIATGFDEGGTVPAKVVGTFDVIPMVVDVAQGIPVLAAGGISDERTAKAAFALGAEGLLVGTAYLASKESRMADNIKEKMLNTTAEDMLMFRAPNSFYRSLPGELPNKLVEMDKQGATADEIWQAAGNYDDLRQGMLFGKLDKGIASFGMGISMIHSIDSAEKITNRLYSGIPEERR